MKPIRRKDSRIWVRFLYFYNDLYNLIIRKIMGNLDNERINSGEHISYNKESIVRANATQAAWLLNIDRCIRILKSISSLTDIQIKQMRWIDVGCGNGLASIYVAAKFGLKSQLLFDFDSRCIEQSKKKYEIFKNSFLGIFFRLNDPEYMHADAAQDQLPKELNDKNIIYMYNPFDEFVLSRFLEINIELINSGSVIFYLNDIHKHIIMDKLKDKISDYRRNDFYEISVFLIGN